jgi:hypothetical protein
VAETCKGKLLYSPSKLVRARGSVFCCGTMLQTVRSRVRFPIKSLDFFFSLPNPSSRTVVLGLTQPLTDMSTRNLPGGGGVNGGRRVRLTALPPSASRLSGRCWILDVSQPYGSSWPVTGMAEPLLNNSCCIVSHFAVVAKQQVYTPQHGCFIPMRDWL